MVKGAAYLVLALLVIGAMAAYLLFARSRTLADIDRRLASLTTVGSAPPQRSATVVPVPARYVPVFAQAQIEVTAKMLRIAVAIGLGLAVLTLVAFGPAATLVMLVGLPLLVLAYVRHRARSRIEQLIEAMPHYIDNVRQLQAVGNSLSQALDRALADAPPIVQSFFAPAARRLELGAPVGETMQLFADRLQVPEISMLAAAIKTNQRYGGSLGTVLRNLSNILRERLRIKRELKAATSEAKVSSRVLIAMPIISMILLVILNPTYIDFFIHDERGRHFSVVAIVLQGAGIYVIRRMMRLEF